MVRSVGHDIVHHMVWRVKARYIIWPCGYGLVYGMA